VEVEMLRALTLLLSHRCNLSCSYCYQRERSRPARMPWSTARAAIDLLLSGTSTRLAVELSGGEPALEPALLRRCVSYLGSAAPPGTTVNCSLTTNGTVVDDDLLAFLADHDVRLDLSFDGVPAAQDLRGAGTSPTLERLLERARRKHPEYFARRVVVRVVVHPVTLPYLAASVRHLMDRLVPHVGLSPAIGSGSGWGPECDTILRDQVSEIVADSLRHLDATGTVPVAFLGGGAVAPPTRVAPPRCPAVSGRCVCVDASGRAWGCPLFASSLRRLPPLAASAAAIVAFGSIHDRAIASRLAALPGRASDHPLFSGRARRCGSRRCADCELSADCLICPAAICEQPPGVDLREVPESHCAFSRVTLDARRRFREQRARAGPQRCPADLADALRAVATALRSADPGPPAPQA